MNFSPSNITYIYLLVGCKQALITVFCLVFSSAHSNMSNYMNEDEEESSDEFHEENPSIIEWKAQNKKKMKWSLYS